MANDVFANGNEIACKKASGKVIACMPNVVFTPPDKVPPTPPGVPIPYPQTAFANKTAKGSKKVRITKKPVMLKNKSYFKTSIGDIAGKTLKKGIITSKQGKKSYFNRWSMNVKFEGKNVDRHFDISTQNHASFPGNTPPWVYTDTMEMGGGGAAESCDKEKKKAEQACKGKKTKKQQCKDEDCKSAKKCLLVSYNQGKRKSANSSVACCPGEQPHHLVEAHSFCKVGDRGGLLDKFASKDPAYRPEDAPCVCAAGDRFSEEHGMFHALQGKKETAAVRKAKGKKKEFAWNYTSARNAGVDAHKKIFPKSNCRKKCLNAQLDSYHKSVGVKSNSTLRTYDASKNLQDWQKNQGTSHAAVQSTLAGGPP